MIKILFVCHGNICRSPMAEFVFKDIVKKHELSEYFNIASAATSTEEVGNPVHSGTRNLLQKYGISTNGKYAVQLVKEDYNKYDLLLGMDRHNISNIMKILKKDPENKVKRLMEFTDSPRDIADPWYTHDFESTYSDILEGCNSLFAWIVASPLYPF